MTTREWVGVTTSTGAHLCLECEAEGMREAHHLGTVVAGITDPAPGGVYRPEPESAAYDAPCYACGWAIRRAS